MRFVSSLLCCKLEETRENTTLLRLWFFFAVLVSNSACPDKCVCFTSTVKCVNQGLFAVPQTLPANTKTLFITGNNISHLTAGSFPVTLEQLTDLYLTGNQVELVDHNVFNNLPNLRLLDLSNNRILNFSAQAFPDYNKLLDLNLSRAFYNHTSMDELFSLLRSGGALQLTSLDLSNNDLVVLPEGMFSHLSNLTILNLQNNSLIFIRNGTLSVPPLRELDLRDNALRELPNTTLMDFSLKPGLQVHLAGNPWRCDCNIEDLVAWLKSSEQVTDKQNMTCSDPEVLRQLPLLQIEHLELECTFSGEMKGVLETSYVFLGMVLALIGVIFLLVLYLNRKGIKRWIYNIRDACRDHMEGYHYRYEINSDPRLANLGLNSDV
ncbi:trophoblast glycoprotein-like [Coregonus clupeaformis]|uniref:trophoblast glycoprotein-like n=1 Tax=Coregonus clupeaformis TaxID=59861 RepID=UPI001BE0534D|nr:trophoblast glycoprotein-like [Coregonus clupeaformis]